MLIRFSFKNFKSFRNLVEFKMTPAQKIKDLYENDKEELKKYTQVLYAQARLIEGLPVENPTQISNLICEIIAK